MLAHAKAGTDDERDEVHCIVGEHNAYRRGCHDLCAVEHVPLAMRSFACSGSTPVHSQWTAGATVVPPGYLLKAMPDRSGRGRVFRFTWMSMKESA